MKKTLTLFLLAFYTLVQAQDLPAALYYSTDGRILLSGKNLASGFYDTTTIKNVYLSFSQADYWTRLTNNYASETLLEATMTYEGVTYPMVGVRFRGNTSYTQIGTSQKKSFEVETDFVDSELRVAGYKNLKFNNAHQDASFMREVLYGRMAMRYVPIAKANYIHLYINNQDWGIYPNIQSVDKAFLSEWFLSNDGARFRATLDGNAQMPRWGDGTAGMNYLGADTNLYKQYYDLKSSDISYPWQTLAMACFALSTASAANQDTVRKYLDIDRALWFLAVENIFTDDDSYVMKGKMDYVTYYEPETGRTTPLEYDGNSTFQTAAAASASWSPFKNVTNVNYPLLNKLLNVPEWRQRYLAHYRTILQETFTSAYANTLIDQLNSQISGLVASDPKKLYTTQAYIDAIPALKSFVTTRRNYLLSNIEVAETGAAISSAPFFDANLQAWNAPHAKESVVVRASVTSSKGIAGVYLYHATGIVGNFSKQVMFDDGAHEDGSAGDGVYGAQIPGYAAGTVVRYYVEAIAANAARTATYLPVGAEHDVFVYTVSTTARATGVVINELLASNSADTTDAAGDHEDWVELYNNNTYEVDLSGFYLSDNSTNLAKWTFPAGTSIPAKGYLVVWADDEASEGPLHAAWKLSASGESVTLSDSSLTIIDQVVFGVQQTDQAYARVPNGTGPFAIQPTTFNSTNSPVTGVESLDFVGGISVFPNPFGSQITLKLEDAADLPVQVELYNSIGQRVQSGYITTPGSVEWNTGHISSGIYWLKVSGAGKVKTLKIVKAS